MKGWDERVALSAEVVATVTARRGEARLNLGDYEHVFDEELLAALQNLFDVSRNEAGGVIYVTIGGDFTLVATTASRTDALLATMRAALKYSKGG